MSPTSCQTAPPSDWEANYSAAPDFASNELALLQRLSLSGPGPPDEQTFLDLGDDYVQDQRKAGEHENSGKHRIDVEHALGLQDEITHTLGRAEVLADDRAHERHADRRVQTGEHPRRRRGQVNAPQQLAFRCPQHPRVSENRRDYFFYALENVEEHDEEDKGHAEGDLRSDAEPEPHRKH